MLDRRTFLAGSASAGLAAVAAVTGCSGGGLLGFGDTVKVAVAWSGTELNAFRAVLEELELRDYRVELIPLGDDIATAFAQHTSRRPDVILLPQPGLVATHLDMLAPLPDTIATEPWPYSEVWKPLLFHGSGSDKRLYGLPFKVTHKSVVWYRKSVFASHGLVSPQWWSEWLALNDVLIDGGVAPLALAGADGWMLTDFFENVLVGCEPGAYSRLSCGGDLSAEPAVGKALRLLGRMWAAKNALAGGATGSLVQQFADAVVEVFGHERAAMVVAPDFAEPVVRRFAAAGDIGVFRFPMVDGDSDDSVTESAGRPLIVGGDVAVLSKLASDHARDLVTMMWNPRVSLPWINEYGGFLAADRRTPPDKYSGELRMLADGMADRRSELRFDLSDQLGPIGGSGGLWRVLQDFLARVGGSGDVDGVRAEADEALLRLGELEE